MRVLRRLLRNRLHLPRAAFVAFQLEIELADVALLQILETEIRPEESSGAVLKRDALLASDVRTPHPLVAGAVGMVYDQQAHTLHLRGRCKTQDGLAITERTQPVVHPTLGSNVFTASDHLQSALVVLGVGALPALYLLHDLARVLRPRARPDQQNRRQESTHIRAPPPASRAPRFQPVRATRGTPRPESPAPKPAPSQTDTRIRCRSRSNRAARSRCCSKVARRLAPSRAPDRSRRWRPPPSTPYAGFAGAILPPPAARPVRAADR